MRGLRSTLALLVVLVGLGAYIYFVASKEDGTSSSPEREDVFASLESGDIQEVTVRSEGAGVSTTVRKDDDSWRIVEPIAAPASGSEISGITSALDQLEITRVIDESPSDLSSYGLAEPRFDLALRAPLADGLHHGSPTFRKRFFSSSHLLHCGRRST